MNRRTFLIQIGCVGGSLGGCLSGGVAPDTESRRTSAQPSNPTTRCSSEKNTWTDIAGGTRTPLPTTSQQSVTGLKPVEFGIRIQNREPKGNSAHTLTLRITRQKEDNCEYDIFKQVYTLAPGEEISLKDPIGTDGTYQLRAKLRIGATATRTIETSPDGIPDSEGYLVQISNDTVAIGVIEE